MDVCKKGKNTKKNQTGRVRFVRDWLAKGDHSENVSGFSVIFVDARNYIGTTSVFGRPPYRCAPPPPPTFQLLISKASSSS